MRRKLIIAGLVVAFIVAVLATESEWMGTDDTVVGSLSEKAGVHETQLLPWNLTGDLQLFVFCAGGAVAGFAAGYYWRALFGGTSGERMAHAAAAPAPAMSAAPAPATTVSGQETIGDRQAERRKTS